MKLVLLLLAFVFALGAAHFSRGAYGGDAGLGDALFMAICALAGVCCLLIAGGLWIAGDRA